MIQRILLTLTLLLCASLVPAQRGGVPFDEKAENLLSLGKRHLQTGMYAEAAQAFELALQRPLNRVTTACLLYGGMAHLRAGNPQPAVKLLEELRKYYPSSTYVEEACLPLGIALGMSTTRNDRERGLDLLLKTAETARSMKLRGDCLNAAKNILFNRCDLEFTQAYLMYCPESAKTTVNEAMFWHLDQTQGYKVPETLAAYQRNGGSMTPFLSDLKRKYETAVVRDPRRLHVALFLSFNLGFLDTATVSIPEKSLKPLEFYEGLMMAFEKSGLNDGRSIVLKAFDTRGDSLLIQDQLKELRAFGPDIIIGDIKTGLAQQISAWAEQNRVVHIIPRNARDELITNKRYTFLMHPSINTHGVKMADHFLKQGKRRFAVMYENSPLSQRFAQGFKRACDSVPGATVKMQEVPWRFSPSSVSSFIKSLQGGGYDVLYVPIASEENAGMVVSSLNLSGIKIQLAGSPDWETFSAIDGELKTKFNLVYSQFSFIPSDTVAYPEFQQAWFDQYHLMPSENSVWGYDLGMFLLKSTQGGARSQSMADLIRAAAPMYGLHQTFGFSGRQDNQNINILQYMQGRLVKVNGQKP